eukprot:3609425-Pleurochrysis_carterae.AAC.1
MISKALSLALHSLTFVIDSLSVTLLQQPWPSPSPGPALCQVARALVKAGGTLNYTRPEASGQLCEL